MTRNSTDNFFARQNTSLSFLIKLRGVVQVSKYWLHGCFSYILINVNDWNIIPRQSSLYWVNHNTIYHLPLQHCGHLLSRTNYIKQLWGYYLTLTWVWHLPSQSANMADGVASLDLTLCHNLTGLANTLQQLLCHNITKTKRVIRSRSNVETCNFLTPRLTVRDKDR